ncbi:MAG TPA: hypothetical protein VGI67_10880 [Thermoleophilaceae bacterium]|jgi:hypothetical protein
MTRDETLRQGVEILDDVMGPARFRFEPVHDGAYACCRYRRADRTLELHFSDSLRLVSQRIGDVVVMHDDFMRALVGPGGGRYPGSSTDPLDDFHGLSADLRSHCAEFLRGNPHKWRAVAERALRDPRRFTITHEFLQLEEARRDARSAFAAHEFAKVVALYEPLERQLMPAECRRLEIARERVRTGWLDGW